MKCPNCKSSVKRKNQTRIDFVCGSCIWPVSMVKPLIRCTPNEKSFDKIVVVWKNKLGQIRKHSIFNCSETYAKSWFQETITEGIFIGFE